MTAAYVFTFIGNHKNPFTLNKVAGQHKLTHFDILRVIAAWHLYCIGFVGEWLSKDAKLERRKS